MLHRDAVSVTVRGLDISAARYIKCGMPNKLTKMPKKVGDTHIT